MSLQNLEKYDTIRKWSLILESKNVAKCCKMHVPKSVKH